MYLSTLGGCFLFFTSALAGVVKETHLKFDVKIGEEVTSESVDVNYQDNYVTISTSAHQNAKEIVMLHDYSQGVNVFKRGDNCFLLDQFDEVPEYIEDWENLRTEMAGDSADLGQEKIFNNYQLRALPFFVERSTLPDSVQTLCPGPIRILIPDDSRKVEKEDEEALEDEEYSEIFLPLIVVPRANSRVKRGSLLDRIRDRSKTRTSRNGEWFRGLPGRISRGGSWDVQVGGGSDQSGNPYGRVGISRSGSAGTLGVNVGATRDSNGNPYGTVGISIRV